MESKMGLEDVKLSQDLKANLDLVTEGVEKMVVVVVVEVAAID